jgi:hypothetical protein
LFSSHPSTVLNEVFFNPETEMNERWCKKWLNTYLTAQTLTYSAAITIVLVNLIFRRLLKPVVLLEHAW